jgi:hypothetical protein
MIFSNAMSSDLLDTISDLELKKRDLSIIKSEIYANLEYAQNHLELTDNKNHLAGISKLVEKQEALLDTFIVLEEKLDLIELKAKFLDLKDMTFESQVFNDRKLKVQNIIDNTSYSKNLKRYLNFFLNEKFEQAIILKSVLNFQELSVLKTFESESELLKNEKLEHEGREVNISLIRKKVAEEITSFYGTFKSLYKLHSLSQSLRQSYDIKAKQI